MWKNIKVIDISSVLKFGLIYRLFYTDKTGDHLCLNPGTTPRLST